MPVKDMTIAPTQDGHGGATSASDAMALRNMLDKYQRQQGESIVRLETKIEYIEKDIADIKGDISHIKKDTKDVRSTIDRAIGSVNTIKWFIGVGIAGIGAISGYAVYLLGKIV